MARAGGGGGGGHSSGGHSSGGGFGGGHSFGGGHGFGGGGIGFGFGIFGIIIGVVLLILYFILKAYFRNNKPEGALGAILGLIFAISGGGSDDDGYTSSADGASLPYPEGLNEEKVKTSFLGIQDAWQKKDLKLVRKWISDGVYQRFNGQFIMMNKLSQVNKLSNIQIARIRVANIESDGNYQTADVAVHFKMDDEFISEKYPQFNEKFRGDDDTEYWTFIKRNGPDTGKNLYNSNNCPNCGATFDVDMGEISRCGSCGTLTNNASYDWVLSEITQEADYSPGRSVTNQEELKELTKHDDTFSIQRMEDVASNVFMQVMQVMGGEKPNKLDRFAIETVKNALLEERKQSGNIVFDRLYLNEVSMITFYKDTEKLHIVFSMKCTYQRVKAEEKLTLLDRELTSRNYSLTLSKNLKALQTPAKETVFSYECASCGSPYGDTTLDKCAYCDAPIIDYDHNWVLTQFQMS